MPNSSFTLTMVMIYAALSFFAWAVSYDHEAAVRKEAQKNLKHWAIEDLRRPLDAMREQEVGLINAEA